MQKQFILLGILLASHLSTSAQTVAPEIAPAEDRLAETVPIARTEPTTLLAAFFLPPENFGKSGLPFSYQFEEVYECDQDLESLESLSMMRQVKTLFLTESSLPLVQFWSGRLQFDGFTSTLHMQNVQLGPSAAGGLRDFRPARQRYPGGPRSVDLYGLSLSFHFGRDEQIGRPTQIWRRLARIVSAIR